MVVNVLLKWPDIFYFNGLANNPNNMWYMPNASNPNNSNNLNNLNNLNSYYPSIYKIVYPVVQRVIAGTNYQYINEDMINDMVNTVSGIVEGDINNIEKCINEINIISSTS